MCIWSIVRVSFFLCAFRFKLPSLKISINMMLYCFPYNFSKSTMDDPILNKILQIDKSNVQETKNSEINYKHYELVTYMKNIIIWADAKYVTLY